MELRNINSDNLNAVKQAQIAFQESIKQTAKAQVLGSGIALEDSANADSFKALKASVAGSTDPNRAEYIQTLKAAVASGSYNLAGKDIADAMFTDGTAEFLF